MERPRISTGSSFANLACLIALMVAGPAPATAGPAEDAEVAREHTKRATAAYNLGHYGEAAGEFETAYRLVPDPALLFNVAQAWRLAGQPDKALTGYKSYLRTAPPGAGDRAQAERWKQELERHPVTRPTPPTPAAMPTPVATTPVATSPVAASPVVATPVVATPIVASPTAPPPGTSQIAATDPVAPVAGTASATSALPQGQAQATTEPVYKSWWFWTIVGVAAAGVTTALILGRDEQNPDCLGISPCGSLR